MNTPSHFLISAAIEKGFPRIPIVRRAFLMGSVAPDLPLWALSLGGMVYYHWIRGWSMNQTFTRMFDDLYFNHPVWLTLHNFLHAPLVLLAGIALVWTRRRNIGTRSRWLFWFLGSCSLHSLIDVLTHANDGPLLLFPFSFSIRFYSPISYWDPQYYGNEFQMFEQGLNVTLLIYSLSPAIYRWLRRRSRQQFR